jgi:cell division transport system permease protein
VRKSADDVSVFLHFGITDQQRQDLGTALEADPLVLSFTYESHEQAFHRFKVLWRDSPDLVKTVTADQLPESFRVQLKDPETYMAFVAGFKNTPGVDQIVGSSCPTPHASSGEGE